MPKKIFCLIFAKILHSKVKISVKDAKKLHFLALYLIVACVIAILINGPSISLAQEKLRLLNIRYQNSTEGRIETLTISSAEWVYLVSIETLEKPEWPSIRVLLAQANRYYIVYGPNLISKQFVQAMRDGAFDVLSLHEDGTRWIEALEKAQSSQKLWLDLYGGNSIEQESGLLGESAVMRALRRTVERVGATDATVLIYGPSGAGKEKIARALHQKEGAPFIALNCAAIPKDLLEAELFGAAKGAYTGAATDRVGLVREANGGTLFLDEIGELNISLQPKLLRFLETRRARSVGGSAEYEANARIISATNRDLQACSTEGTFRLDLYYRLAEVTLRAPSLSERLEDIPTLATAFMQMAGERFGKHFKLIEPELIARWRTYSWPGNVRELKHTVEQLVLFYDGPVLRNGWWQAPMEPTTAISEANISMANTPSGRSPVAASNGNLLTPRQEAFSTPILNRKQKLEAAKRLLQDSGNDYAWVASQLGIHPTTLYRWRMRNKF